MCYDEILHVMSLACPAPQSLLQGFSRRLATLQLLQALLSGTEFIRSQLPFSGFPQGVLQKQRASPLDDTNSSSLV